MKIYLDDERTTPEGWQRTYTAKETIEVLKAGGVTEVSLDHDLALLHYAGDYSKEETGYDVLLWIEEQVFTNPEFICPIIHIHTANPSAREKMEMARKNIYRRLK